MRTSFRIFWVLALLALTFSQARSEPISVPDLERTAFIHRDTDGIAHLVANSEHDLFFLQGWVHAEDRLFQMDFSRRQASGTLAELLGSAALGSDVELRTLGLRRAAERSLPVLSQETQQALDAYAAGVNAYVEQNPLPPEYDALELTTFAPWTPLDSVAVGKLLALDAALGGIEDIELTEALLTYQAAGTVLRFDGTSLFFEDLFRSAPFEPVATIGEATPTAELKTAAGPTRQRSAEAGRTPLTDRSETLALCRRYLERVRRVPLLQNVMADAERSQGSNVWVVSGRHTASGRPLLANDPHRTLSAPSDLYPIHLRATSQGIDAIGSGAAGIPFLIVGQNQRIVWGATRNPADVTDVYQEQVVPDPSSPSGLSTIYQGLLEPIIPLPQVFQYNQIGDGILDNLATGPPGGTVDGTDIPAAVLIVPRRNQGPIIELDLTAGFALSVQSTLFSGTRELDALRGFARARDLDGFTDAVQLSDVGLQNWVYADARGNIAFFAGGEIPLREDLQASTITGLPPFFVRNGAGGNEWLPLENPQSPQAVPYQILPFEEMPQVINPPDYIVNANNDPLGITFDNNALNQLRPGGGIFYLNPGYVEGLRAFRITLLLEDRIAQGDLTGEDMKAIQADVVMRDAQVFTPFILDAFTNASMSGAHPLLIMLAADPPVTEAVGRLGNWDFSTPTGISEGYDASDVDGELSTPTGEEIDASIAATLYSVWRGQLIRNTIDITLDGIEAILRSVELPRPGSRESVLALRNLLDDFDVNQGFGASGVNFFNVPGVEDPATRRDIIILKSLADTLDLLAGEEFDTVFGGSTLQDDYRWGLLHRLVLEHPLGAPFSIPPAGGAFPPPLPDLPGIPIDGGFRVVDASNHSARANRDDEFMLSGRSGPSHRYVSEPGPFGRRSVAESSLPGGVSGVLGSPFYTNLLGRWLTNDTYPLRQSVGAIMRDLLVTQVFRPKRFRPKR